MSKYFTRSLSGLALAGSALLAACGTDATGPGAGNGGSQFGSPMSISQFDSTLGTGSTRIEIKLLPGGLEAREVHVEADDAEEKIVSQVTAIDPVAGTVTLALGGMQVSYGSGTRFRTPSDSRVTRAEWEAAIASALGSGSSSPASACSAHPSQGISLTSRAASVSRNSARTTAVTSRARPRRRPTRRSPPTTCGSRTRPTSPSSRCMWTPTTSRTWPRRRRSRS